MLFNFSTNAWTSTVRNNRVSKRLPNEYLIVATSGDVAQTTNAVLPDGQGRIDELAQQGVHQRLDQLHALATLVVDQLSEPTTKIK